MVTKQKKGSWLKRLLKIFCAVVVLLVIGIVIAYAYLGTIVKEAVTRFVPPITGTTASVEDVDLSLLQGRIAIRGLAIGNPEGFSTNNIFELGEIQVSFDPKSVLSPKIVIQSVQISDTKVSAELKNLYSLESNIGALQKNINAYLGTEKKAAETASKTPQKQDKETAKGAGKQVVVRDLTVRGTKISLGASGQTITLPLPNIHKTNIGEGSDKKSITEVIADILNSISLESLQAIATSVGDLLKQGLEGTKNMLGAGVDQIKDVAGSVSDGTKNAVKNLKSLFQ